MAAGIAGLERGVGRAGMLMGLGVALSAGTALAQPSNDNLRSAFRISSVTSSITTGDTAGATRESGEPSHGGPGARSAWFSWVAPGSGTVVLTTAGSNFDTLLGAYRTTTGSSTTSFSQLVRLASNDDASDGLTSRVNFSVVAGQTYYFAIDGFSGASGSYRLNLTSSLTPPSGVSNDLFSRAFSLGSSTTGGASGTNRGATVESGEPRHAGSGGRSVWFRWTAPSNGRVTFNTLGSNFDTLLAAYTGSVVNGLSVRASNDDSTDGLTSAIAFDVEQGTTYSIAVDGFSGAVGNYNLSWNFEEDDFEDGFDEESVRPATAPSTRSS